MSDGRLYLVNGDSAAGVLAAARLADDDAVLVLHDVLSCGALAELSAAGGPADWLPGRERFWSRVWDDAARYGVVEGPFPGFMNKPRNLYAAGARLRAAPELVLCTGAGLSDVLAQGFFIAWAEALAVEPGRLHEVQLAGLGAPPVGLPHLDPASLAAAWRVAPLTPRRRAGALAFWRAFVAAQPAGLLPADSGMSPAAVGSGRAAALSAWQRRHPDSSRPLAAWDERLLRAARADGATLKSVLGTVLRAAHDDHDPVGDLVLLHRLVMLAADDLDAPGRAGPPLLQLGGARGLNTTCRVTDAGRAVLSGQASEATAGRRAAWTRSLA